MNKQNIFLAIVAVAVLTACGSSKSTKKVSVVNPPAPKPVVNERAALEKQIADLLASGTANAAAIKAAEKKLSDDAQKDYKAAIAKVETGNKIKVGTETITLDAATVTNGVIGGLAKDDADAAVGKYVAAGTITPAVGTTPATPDNTKPQAGIYAKTDASQVKAFIHGGTGSTSTDSNADQIAKAATIAGTTATGAAGTTGIVYYTGGYVQYDASKEEAKRFDDNTGTHAGEVAVKANFVAKTVGINYDVDAYATADQSGKIRTNGMIEYGTQAADGSYTGHGKFFSGTPAGITDTAKKDVGYVAGSDTEGTLTRAFTAAAK